MILVAVGLLLEAGCAKIAEPLPPLIRIPQPATDLSVRQLADSIVLTFSEPTRNTDGSPVKTLGEVRVLRLLENANEKTGTQPLPDESFLHRAETILTISPPDLPSYVQNGSIAVRDASAISGTSPPAPPVFRYAVLFVNKKNQAAGLSNQVRISPVSLPSHPTGFRGEVTENSIHLTWKAPTENTDGTRPPRIAGYNIYRSEEEGEMPAAPINPEPVQSLSYEDRSFQFDKTYYYAVSTVGNLEAPYAESLPSGTYPVVTRDVFPPAPPDNFNAAIEGKDVILLWAPSTSADVAGYRLFRQDNKDKGSATLRSLQEGLIAILSFRDGDVQPGKSYEYTLQAVDKHGNESEAVHTELNIP